MNYNHVNKIADWFRLEMAPHLTNRMNVSDFGNYISRMCDAPSCKWMRQELKAFPINYFVDPEKFVVKYAKNCVTFLGSPAPQDGAFTIIYQISPTLHVLARVFNWIEQEEVKAYLMLTVAYKDQKEFFKFYDDNVEIRLSGNTEERETGFAPVRNNNGIENLFKAIQSKQETQETNGDTEMCGNPEEELNR